jgi:hypothetical protein
MSRDARLAAAVVDCLTFRAAEFQPSQPKTTRRRLPRQPPVSSRPR